MTKNKAHPELENYCSQKIRLENADDIYRFALEADTVKKHAKIILLDKENYVLYVSHINDTMHNYNLVEVSFIIRMMIEFHAHSIIYIVNYPEGKTQPDKYDFGFKQQLRDATFICGFLFKDYMLLNQQGYYSYAENRLI